MNEFSNDNLRLQIEVPNSGLNNLIPNPDGLLGAWGWVTPVANTYIATGSQNGVPVIAYSSPANVASYFRSELMDVVPGEYISARFDVATGNTAGVRRRMRFEFWDSAGALLSNGPQTPLQESTGTHYVPSMVIPTNAAYASLRLDFYSTSGGNPTVAFVHRAGAFMVSTATTGGTVRENLVRNPSFEVNTTGWEASNPGAAAIARVVTSPAFGTACLRITTAAGTSADIRTATGNAGIPVVAGRTYNFSAYVRAGTVGRIPRLTIAWYDADGTILSAATYARSTATTTSWSRINAGFIAPVNAAYVALYLGVKDPGANEQHFIDAVQFELAQPGPVGDYFDGSITNTATTAYTWSGTAHNSSSLATTGIKTTVNMMPNPIPATTNHWTAALGTGSLVSQIARVTFNSTIPSSNTGINWAASSLITATPGKTYSCGANFRTSKAQKVMLYMQFLDSGGANIGNNAVERDIAANTVTRVTVDGKVAPAGTTTIRVLTYASPAGTAWNNGDWLEGSRIMLNEGETAATYFSGDTANTGDAWYDWSGTQYASASTYTQLPTYEFADTNDWLDVLGGTSKIDWNRTLLQPGLLSASIKDSDLDPAKSSVIRPGKKIRMQVLAVNDIWHDLYNGRVTNAVVDYDALAIAQGKPGTKIELTASDNIATLSNQPEERSVATVPHLAHILEGKGVPYRLNGSGNQAGTATIVAKNDNASVLDQIAITRDTRLATAFVNRSGVLEVWDEANRVGRSTRIANAGFEAGNLTNWNWTSTFTPLLSASGAYSGSYAFRANSGALGTISTVYTNPGTSGAPVSGGASYAFSAFVKGLAGGSYFALFLREYDASGTLITGGSSPRFYADGNWQHIKRTVVTNANTRFMSLVVAYYPQVRGTEPFWIDSTNATHVEVSLDESIYGSTPVFNFNMETCINSVLVKWLRYDIGTEQTTEITYGPYENALAKRTWGARQATYTIGGAAASETEANISAYARSVLESNAVPRRMVKSVTIPLNKRAQVTTSRALMELGTKCRVTNTALGHDDLAQVSTVGHSITTAKTPHGYDVRWTMQLDFEAPESVGVPRVVPSV